MSTEENNSLFERAAEMVDYWTNTLWERLIERDMDNNDLEALSFHVREAENERDLQETWGE